MARLAPLYMKAFTVLAAAVALAPAAHAGGNFYANPEINSSSVGTDFVGRSIETHVGYSYAGDGWSAGGQLGPAFIQIDGEDPETELSGKVYGSLDILADGSLSVYGELSAMTGEGDLSTNFKKGVMWKF